ncbi:MAG: hypothetical protein ACJAUP_002486 [Cellvibrionaceae bacterium]|jgi:hypothetical protein
MCLDWGSPREMAVTVNLRRISREINESDSLILDYSERQMPNTIFTTWQWQPTIVVRQTKVKGIAIGSSTLNTMQHRLQKHRV